MSSSSSITKLINSIQNGQRGRLLSITVPKSKINIACCKLLQENGYIRGYRLLAKDASPFFMQVLLKYIQGKPVVNRIVQVSKPSRRVYLSMALKKESKFKKKNYLSLKKKMNFWTFDEIDRINQFMKGVMILSTSKGLLNHLEAYKISVGGEVLIHVY